MIDNELRIDREETTVTTQDMGPELVRRDTGLVWGIKKSFMEYVSGWPGSTMDLAPGSGWLADGLVYFSPDPQRPTPALWFRGGVRLRAHDGMLDVTVSDPRVDEQDNRYLLTGETWNDGTWDRIPLAELHWQGNTEVEDAEPTNPGEGAIQTFTATALLHPDATGLFDNTYPAGEPLSPLTIRMEQGI